MKNETVAATRTSVNTTILLYLVIGLNWWRGWNISIEDLTPFLPVIVVVIGFFTRISLAINKKWPPVGWLLFGYKETPNYG